MKRLLFVFLFFISSQPVFGYNFKDLCREMAPTEKASKAILGVLKSLEKIEVDKDTQGIMDFVWEGMDRDSFYFGDIYRSTYFKPAKDGYRAITLQHCRKPGSNEIRIVPECYEDATVQKGQNYMGIMEFGIRSNPIASQLRKYRSFSLRFRSKEAWENAGEIQPAYMADGFLKIIDPTNLKQLEVGEPCSFNEDKDHKDETRIFVNNFCHTFPAFSGVISQYLEINDFLKVESVDGKKCNQGPGKIDYTHIELTPALKQKALKKDFPDLAKGMDKWRKLITFQGVLKNKRGNTYGKITITPKKTLIEGYSYQGKLIPYDKDGNLVFEEAGTLDTEPELVAEGWVKVDFLGVEVVFDGSMFIEHISTDKDDSFKIKLETINYKYTGRLLGFIPMSVVRFLSPIDIDQFADDMMYTVLRANDGEGSLLSIGWEIDNERNRLATVCVSTEMLDHYMIQFIMRYARVFIGSDNRLAFEQTQEFFDKFLSAVITDMEAVYADMDFSQAGLVQR